MSRKLTKSEVDADRALLRAIEGLPDYQSVNPAYSLERLQQLEISLTAADQERRRLRVEARRVLQALAQASDVEATISRTLHSSLVTAKSQVVAQYGRDSYAMTAIGLTRTSDRKRPARKRAAR